MCLQLSAYPVLLQPGPVTCQRPQTRVPFPAAVLRARVTQAGDGPPAPACPVSTAPVGATQPVPFGEHGDSPSQGLGAQRVGWGSQVGSLPFSQKPRHQSHAKVSFWGLHRRKKTARP